MFLFPFHSAGADSRRGGVSANFQFRPSGHCGEQLLGVEGASEIPGFFDVLLHLGTLVAVFVAYWPEIRDMILEFFRGIGDLIHGTTPTPVPPARRMILLVIVGTLPLFVIPALQGLDRGAEQQPVCGGPRPAGYRLPAVCLGPGA